MTDADRVRLHEALERHEARRLTPYMDCCGKPFRVCLAATDGHKRGNLTIAVGVNIETISDEECDLLTGSRVNRAEDELRRTFPWFRDLDSVRQAAMVELCFNLGLTRLLTFVRALTAMAAKNYAKAADDFLDSKWARDVKQGRAVTVTEQIRTGRWA